MTTLAAYAGYLYTFLNVKSSQVPTSAIYDYVAGNFSFSLFLVFLCFKLISMHYVTIPQNREKLKSTEIQKELRHIHAHVVKQQLVEEKEADNMWKVHSVVFEN